MPDLGHNSSGRIESINKLLDELLNFEVQHGYSDDVDVIEAVDDAISAKIASLISYLKKIGLSSLAEELSTRASESNSAYQILDELRIYFGPEVRREMDRLSDENGVERGDRTAMKKPKNLDTSFSSYSVGACIGQGGNGYVYKATDQNGDFYAIKILDPERATTEKRKRFKNEYEFCSSKHHDNIIHVLDHGLAEGGEAFLVMPLYEGSLRSLIGNIEGTLAFELTMKIFRGIEAAHLKGVVHRDLKPENILHSNNGVEIVVADFGIARFSEDELYTAVETKDATRLANFQYAAPEQRSKGGQITAASDIYALGLILNEIFTSQVPHGMNYKTIESVAPEYAYLDPIVGKMLQQDPNQRHKDLDEIIKEIKIKGRHQVSRQKLSALNNRVIPKNEIDDPLLEAPITIIDFDWDNQNLTLELSAVLNSGWVSAFNNFGGHTAVMGRGPEKFRFSGNKAVIACPSDEVQRVIDYFKEWLPRVAHKYRADIEREAKERERLEIEQLQQLQRKAEERANLLASIKI
ncbi:MAG: serine/threonine protein kinase [Candidatus Hydrogenedentes bacterium]|nr:serine/threonine protein kinase [Candidatus Hydrogenedentota bacterium]